MGDGCKVVVIMSCRIGEGCSGGDGCEGGRNYEWSSWDRL